MLNGMIIAEYWIERDLEGSSRDLIDILSEHLTQWTDEEHVNVTDDSWCLYIESNWAHLDYESRALPLS
jgi:hypothetical protein